MPNNDEFIDWIKNKYKFQRKNILHRVRFEQKQRTVYVIFRYKQDLEYETSHILGSLADPEVFHLSVLGGPFTGYKYMDFEFENQLKWWQERVQN